MRKPELLIKYQRVFFTFLGVGLVFLGWFFLVPRTKQVFEAKKALAQEKKRLVILKAKLADLESLNEFEISERTSLSLRAIPEKKDVIGVMVSLRSQAKERGLTIENLQVSPGELSATSSAQPSSDKLDFKLEMKGSFEAILDFFAKAEKSLPLVSFQEVKVELGPEGTNAKLILASYFLPLPQVLGTIDSPVPKLSSSEEKVLKEISQYSFLPSVSFPPASGRTNPFSF